MGQSVKKLILFCLTLVVVLFLVSSLFVYQTLSDAGDRLSQSLMISTNMSDHDQQHEVIEAYSTFKSEDYVNFNYFSTSLRRPDEVLDELLESGDILVGKDNFLIAQKDIKIQPLEENHCDIAYCYQHKVKFDKIPSLFWKGLIGVEDYRFLNHFGIDFISIIRAIITDLKAMKLVQGGSTLTQQLVKNLYFDNKKTFTRKIKEIVIAVYLEHKYEKENILESYFNEVFWGSYKGVRIKGIYAASLIYFGKRPRQITAIESSILIGMLKGPNFYSPIKKLERIKKRSMIIYKTLDRLGYINASEEKFWDDDQFLKWQKWLLRKNGKLYLDTLWRISLREKKKVLPDFENFSLILSAKKIEAKVNKKYPKKDIAIKIFMKKIGKFEDSTNSEFHYYSKYERNERRALIDEKHQVGSTLKPIIYYIFKKLGNDLNDFVSTDKVKLKLKSGLWAPRESHHVKEKEVMLIEALLQSLNRPVIRLADEIGFDKVENRLFEYVKELKLPLEEYPSQLLGSVEMSLERLWSAYSLFIKNSCEQVNSDEVNSILFEDTIISKLSNPSKTTIRKIVSKRLRPMRFFGKTGTTNQGHENLFVFFDGKYLGIILTAVEGVRSSEKLRLFGSTTSFLIYQDYLLRRGKQINELNCDFLLNLKQNP